LLAQFVIFESILLTNFPLVMQEADVIRIVESTIADKNLGLLASMKSLLDTSLRDLKRSHTDTADSQLKEI